MTNTYQVNGKKVLVIGLARSGKSVAELLVTLGAQVTVNDRADIDATTQQTLKEQGIQVVTGGHPLSLLDESFDLVIKNPGIPYNVPLIERILQLDIPLITEIEFATSMLAAPFIGITGSNGKTTTSELTAVILREAATEHQVILAGNIGVPLSNSVAEISANDEVVLELSSFQLQGSPTIHPHIAAITNIYSAHLDYHGTQAAYEAAKMNITKNQTDQDYLIYNADLAGMREKVAAHTAAQLIPFSRREVVKTGVYIENDWVFFREEAIFPVAAIQLPGLHNRENVLVATAIAKLRGVSNETIEKAVAKFQGVKHRTQFVKEIAGRKYYNDSKATNTQATIQALRGFPKSVVLIAGGLDRGNDMLELVPEFKAHVKKLVTFGQTAEKLAKIGEKAEVQEVITCESVREAVQAATRISEANDIILLSPANASWDQYQTFEERGDDFIEAVLSIEE